MTSTTPTATVDQDTKKRKRQETGQEERECVDCFTFIWESEDNTDVYPNVPLSAFPDGLQTYADITITGFLSLLLKMDGVNQIMSESPKENGRRDGLTEDQAWYVQQVLIGESIEYGGHTKIEEHECWMRAEGLPVVAIKNDGVLTNARSKASVGTQLGGKYRSRGVFQFSDYQC